MRGRIFSALSVIAPINILNQFINLMSCNSPSTMRSRTKRKTIGESRSIANIPLPVHILDDITFIYFRKSHILKLLEKD